MNKNDLQEIEDILKHQIGVVAKGINHKLDLVIEGNQLLAQKIDATRSELKEDINNVDRRLMMAEARLVNKIDTVEERLSKKLDAVAKDLSEHRADTEIHRGYKVSDK